MIPKYFLLFFCVVLSMPVVGQIFFVDSTDHTPISGVNIYTRYGDLIGFSNKDGQFDLLDGIQVKDEDLLGLAAQHISYQTKNINIPSLKTKFTVLLNPRSTKLQEVIISPKNADVIVLKGYFRSLETFNKKNKYFIEGLMEYYIPSNGQKSRFRLLDYRVFCDSVIVRDYDDKMGSFFLVSHIVEIPFKHILKNSKIYSIEKKQPNLSYIMKNEKQAGTISYNKDGESMQIFIDQVLPDTILKDKIFRLEINTKQKVQVENYSSLEIEKANLYHLLNIYQHEVATIKLKAEFGHLPYEILSEFYILDRNFMSSDNFKKMKKQLSSNSYKSPNKSKYSNEFWKNLDQYDIPPINNGLLNQLYQNLKLVH